MKFLSFRPCKEAEGIYDLRFTIYDLRTLPRPACGIPHYETMKRQLTITSECIHESALLSQRRMSPGMGAAVYFAGVVRNVEEGKAISAIEYEAFQRMVEHQFGLIFQEMEKRWPIESVRLIHRTGLVEVNEPSLWVEVVAPHRSEAFAGCQYLIDEMKRTVPIWKKPIV